MQLWNKEDEGDVIRAELIVRLHCNLGVGLQRKGSSSEAQVSTPSQFLSEMCGKGKQKKSDLKNPPALSVLPQPEETLARGLAEIHHEPQRYS